MTRKSGVFHGMKQWRGGGLSGRVLAETVRELHDREHDGDDDKADGAAHDDDHQRFEHGRERIDLDADLFLIVVGNRVEHFFEAAGALADADHVHHKWRKLT